MTDAERKAIQPDLFPTWEFNLGDVVYLRLRSDPLAGMITAIFLRPGTVVYEVSWGNGQSDAHYGIELSRECEL